MSISKSWMQVPKNRELVTKAYRDTQSILTVQAIAEALGTTHQTVAAILKEDLQPAERRALAALRYSVSKTGEKNPMLGKTGTNHHGWKGECDDGYGYLTILWNGKRQFVHRVVMAQALGLSELPEQWVVHHIDDNPKNNDLDNLALATTSGHQRIHALQTVTSSELKLQRGTIVEQLRSLTSP